MARGPARGALLLATAALAAQVYAGYPQFALYSGTVALAWIVGGPGARRGGRLLIACLVAGGAVALAAPQILSGLAMARESIRMGPAREAMMVALERVALRPLDWRDVFRPGALSLLLPCKVAPPTILLALVAVLQARFAPVFLGSVAGGAAILATGPNVLYRALHAVPPLSFFSGPLKLFYLFAFAAMTLAALGLDRVVRAPERSRRLALACLAPAAMLSVGDPLSATSMTLLAGGLVLAAVPARALSLALVAFVVASHVPFLAATHLITAPAFHYPTPFSVLLREPPPRPADGERYLALAGGREVYQVGMNFGALWGLESLNGVGALAQWRQLEVMERAAPGSVQIGPRSRLDVRSSDDVAFEEVAHAGLLARCLRLAGRRQPGRNKLGVQGVADRAVPLRQEAHPDAPAAPQGQRQSAAGAWGAGEQPQGSGRDLPAGRAGGDHRRLGLGQEHAHQRDSLQGAMEAAGGHAHAAGRARRGGRRRACAQSGQHRPVADRAQQPVEPGHGPLHDAQHAFVEG